MKEKLYTIPDLIKKLRITQSQFALDNDYSIQSVHKWCSGKMTPAMATCEKFEKKYDVKLVYRR